jgi:hypothetical protein
MDKLWLGKSIPIFFEIQQPRNRYALRRSLQCSAKSSSSSFQCKKQQVEKCDFG